MKKVKLYEIKKGGKFKFVDNNTGEPEKNTYIKGRPHTDVSILGKTQKYVTTLYNPGESNNGIFAGYTDADREVYKVE